MRRAGISSGENLNSTMVEIAFRRGLNILHRVYGVVSNCQKGVVAPARRIRSKCVWGEEFALKMLGDVGFRDVRVETLEHYIIINYYIMSK